MIHGSVTVCCFPSLAAPTGLEADQLGTISRDERQIFMKSNIHPSYAEITATCSCGNVIKTGSTCSRNLALDVCNQCHPFYTGKQRIVDTGGRVERFNKRFALLGGGS